MTTPDLTALLALCSSGPWQVDPDEPLRVVQHEISCTPIAQTLGTLREREIMTADAQLIALAPTLAAEVIRLRQENDRLSQRLQNLWAAHRLVRAAMEADHD